MMRFQISLLALFAAANVAAESSCHPPSPVPVVPPSPLLDAGPWDGGGERLEAMAVCQRLSSLGCEEGYSPVCVDALERNLRERLVDYNNPCLLAATSKAEVRACSRLVKCP